MSSFQPVRLSLAIATALLSLSLDSKPIQAQSITPAEGTNTIVTPNGESLDISGGMLSGDGSNLFHHFEQFGLNQGEIANFLSNPEIRNILAGVVGGEASLINGLIQVTGGNSNLFLMNPAGIVFGTQASLNVPAAFTATTASSIGFDGGQFNAVGDNNYQALMGDPTNFSFAMEQPGSIINAGDLAVGEGQGLTVVAGQVINTGTFSAPGGTISVASVPGTSQVVINQENMALGLKLDVADLDDNGVGNISPASLGQLVTGGDIVPATEIQVDEQGQVWLAASNQPIPTETGTTIVSGSIDTASSETGGTVHILGQRVGLVDAEIDASGSNGGGTVLVGGDYQGQGEVFNAERTFVNQNSTIQADALTNGYGGTVVLWADDTTQFFGDISSRGGAVAGDGGFVEVSGKENLQFAGTVDTSAINGDGGTLLLDPTDITITAGGTPGGFSGQVMFADAEPTTISENQLESLSGNTNVLLQADNTITIEPMQDGMLRFQRGSGSITFEAGGAFTMAESDTLDARARDLTIAAASITAGVINPFHSFPLGDYDSGSVSVTATNGGISARRVYAITLLKGESREINLSATNGDITIASNVMSSSFNAYDPTGGDITINVTGGSFSASGIRTNKLSGRAGDITVNATNGITVTDEITAKSPERATITLNGVVLTGGPETHFGTNFERDQLGTPPGVPVISVTGTSNSGGSLVSIGTVGTSSSGDFTENITALTTLINGGNLNINNIGDLGIRISELGQQLLNELVPEATDFNDALQITLGNRVDQILNSPLTSPGPLGGKLVGVSPELQQRPGETTLEWAVRITQDVPRVTNSNMAVLEALRDAKRGWDNVVEDGKVREAKYRALEQQLNADTLRSDTDYLLNQ
ncbi:MAG: filamentous hemagglutinin N-terminal domain-containing protein [Coleofasciculus sp. B1-GNL1-01]|uniref:two-partner secretion domain-containing protein n=1 Tax=Coleofasciculus sp. B1-GNL1-01 TaxID=3068484 RepID=UPI0032F6CD03